MIEYTWEEGSASHPDLAAVSVFDSSAAQVYVEEKTEVRFRPFGLDVLDRLASVFVRVRARLEAERSQLVKSEPIWPEIPKGTEVERLLSNLSALTPQNQVTALGSLSSEEIAELDSLTTVLAAARAEDPTKKANALKLQAGRLQRLKNELVKLAENLGEPSVASLTLMRMESEQAATLATNAAQDLSIHAVLDGFGTHEWRALWEAARSYSTRQAYRGHNFPHIINDAKCLLCQETLNTTAVQRFANFEAFVQGAAQSAASAKRKAADEALNNCTSIVPGQNNKDAIDDLELLDSSIALEVTKFVEEARTSYNSLRDRTNQPTPVKLAPPVEAIGQLIAKTEMMAESISKTADPVERKRTESRHAELRARKTLSLILTQVLAEVDRKNRLNSYDRCLKDTDTRAATRLSTDLTTKYVTDALTAGFKDELQRLGFTALELELRAAGGQKGVLYHQVFLKYATKASLPGVVSEGESRCIALAAFLAEVQSAGHASAIVFDDPVSSLDHRWRTTVAKRLVEEAASRQVIVFTHEMVFLYELTRQAEKQGVSWTAQTLRRGRDSLAGRVDQGLPFHGVAATKRIGLLIQDWQHLNKVYRQEGQAMYEQLAIRLYADLRRTWERATEEILLNGVVLRFRNGVETQRLRKVDITAEDIRAVDEGMTKCSKWEGGHDHAPPANEPLPPPEEIKKDIDALETWMTAVQRRRR